MSALRKFLAVFLAALMLPWGAYVAAAAAQADAASALPDAARAAAEAAGPGAQARPDTGPDAARTPAAAAPAAKRKTCRTALLPGSPCSSFLPPAPDHAPQPDAALRQARAACSLPPPAGRSIAPSPEPPRAFL